MTRGTFRLKGRELLDKYDKTIYRAAKDGEVNYSTIHRWVTQPDEVERVEGRILFGFLMGLGLTLEEVYHLQLGDIFEYTPDNGQIEAE